MNYNKSIYNSLLLQIGKELAFANKDFTASAVVGYYLELGELLKDIQKADSIEFSLKASTLSEEPSNHSHS